jgi:hypothetical protein
MEGFEMYNCQSVQMGSGSGVSSLPGFCSLCIVQSIRIFRELPESKQHVVYDQLSELELTGEISEFSALCLHAVLASSVDGELAIEYLEMAEAVSSSSSERAIGTDIRAAFDWLQSSPSATTDSIQTILVQDCHAGPLWNELTIALRQLWDAAGPGDSTVLRPPLVTTRPRVRSSPAVGCAGSDGAVLLQTRPSAAATEGYEERAAS